MSRICYALIGSLLTAATLLNISAPAPAAEPRISFHLTHRIVLPTGNGHGDLVQYDPGNHRIYVSMADAGGAVIDPDDYRIIHIVRSGIIKAAGNTWDDHYVYWTSNGGTRAHPKDRIFVISKKNWKVVYRFKPVGVSPDGIWADRKNHRLYIAMDDSNWLGVYTLGRRPRFIRTVPLFPATGSGPDIGTLRARAGELVMPDDSWEEVIDLKTHKIVQKLNTVRNHAGDATIAGSHAKGQIYDPKTGDLWVGTTKAGMLVINMKTMKIVKRLASRGGIDEVAFDPGWQLVYAFEGKAGGFNVYDAQNMRLLTFVSTGYSSTHTGAVDPRNHRVFAYAGMDHSLFAYTVSKRP